MTIQILTVGFDGKSVTTRVLKKLVCSADNAPYIRTSDGVTDAPSNNLALSAHFCKYQYTGYDHYQDPSSDNTRYIAERKCMNNMPQVYPGAVSCLE